MSVLLVLAGLFAMQLTSVILAPSSRHGFVLGLTLVAAGLVFGLQLFNSSPGATRWPMWQRLGTLLGQGIATYLPLVSIGAEWGGMAGFLAGSILVLMPARASQVLFAIVIASVPLASLAHGADSRVAIYLTAASLSSGLTVFGISRLCLASTRARGASAQLAQLTLVRERERFSRDLHDILGYSLSAITLKAELTKRLVGSNPALASDELAEVAELARQAAADVRLVASGYRNISLATEAACAASVLSAADIAVQVKIDCGALGDKVDTELATVLREAITNVLRHSSARNCAIEANSRGEAVTLSVTNDGVPRRMESFTSGFGLENMAWRLGAIGGELHATPDRDGQFSLLAKVPLPEAPWAKPSSQRGS
jgi:two-component system sensor histidine kinase DesK